MAATIAQFITVLRIIRRRLSDNCSVPGKDSENTISESTTYGASMLSPYQSAVANRQSTAVIGSRKVSTACDKVKCARARLRCRVRSRAASMTVTNELKGAELNGARASRQKRVAQQALCHRTLMHARQSR